MICLWVITARESLDGKLAEREQSSRSVFVLVFGFLITNVKVEHLTMVFFWHAYLKFDFQYLEFHPLNYPWLNKIVKDERITFVCEKLHHNI